MFRILGCLGRVLVAALIGAVFCFVGLSACVANIPDPETGLTPIEESSANDVETITMFAADVYPDYYRIIGVAETAPTDVDDKGIQYGELDESSRPTWAGGWITSEMRAEKRAAGRSDEDIVDPVGWPTVNDEVTIPGADGRRDYHGWLWNRSHMVADSLGGANDVHNMIPGTRTQNVGDNSTPGGMAYTETLAREWLDANDGAVWYMVVPLYERDEMIPRGVVVDIKTSDGEIDQRVLVYNAANGFDIDYATGYWTENGFPF